MVTKDNRSKNEKNIYIECLRFLLVAAICLHHFRMYSDALPFGGTPPAVDCMFIMSGFFTCSHFEKHKETQRNESALKYMKKRYFRLFPAQLGAILIASAIRPFLGNRMTVENIGGYLREIFMVEFAYLDCPDRINPPDWYSGNLLIGTLLLYICLENLQSKKRYYGFAVIAVLFYAVLYKRYGIINLYPRYSEFFNITVFVRTIAGLFMGGFLHFIIDNHKLNKVEKYTKLLWFPVFGISFFIFYVLLWNSDFPCIDYIIVILFCILFILLFVIKEDLPNWLHIVITRLGGMTYVMFLNHYIIACIFTKCNLCRTWDWKAVSLIYLITVLLASGIIQYIGIILRYLWKIVFCGKGRVCSRIRAGR